MDEVITEVEKKLEYIASVSFLFLHFMLFLILLFYDEGGIKKVRCNQKCLVSSLTLCCTCKVTKVKCIKNMLLSFSTRIATFARREREKERS